MSKKTWLKIITKNFEITSERELVLQFFEEDMTLEPTDALSHFGM